MKNLLYACFIAVLYSPTINYAAANYAAAQESFKINFTYGRESVWNRYDFDVSLLLKNVPMLEVAELLAKQFHVNVDDIWLNDAIGNAISLTSTTKAISKIGYGDISIKIIYKDRSKAIPLDREGIIKALTPIIVQATDAAAQTAEAHRSAAAGPHGGPLSATMVGSETPAPAPVALPKKSGWASLKGEAKEDPKKVNEDVVEFRPDDNLYGIFDGSGKTKEVIIREAGDKKSAQEQIDQGKINRKLSPSFDVSIDRQLDPVDLARTVKNTLMPNFFTAGITVSLIKNAFNKTQKVIFPFTIMGSATTAVVAHIIDSKIVVANLGDSSALLITKNGEPTFVSEKSNAAFNLGSDLYKEDKVHVFVRPTTPDDVCLILMSDGINDGIDSHKNILSRTEIQNIVLKALYESHNDGQIAAKALVDAAHDKAKAMYDREKDAKANYKYDDASAIVIVLNGVS